METLGILFWIILIGGGAIVTFWKIFEKAGQPGYTALIPIYNGYKLFDIAEQGLAFFIIISINVFIVMLRTAFMISGRQQLEIAIIIYILIAITFIIRMNVFMKLSTYFGKSKWFGLGLLLLPFIFFPILAFDKSKYKNGETNNQKKIPPKANAAQHMYVDELKNATEVMRKMNLTYHTFYVWKKKYNWEELKVNKHKDKLLKYLYEKIEKNTNNSSAAFKSIFMDLDVDPEFTDNDMMAGLKYIAQNDQDENMREFAKQIMKEGNKTIEDIDISIKQEEEYKKELLSANQNKLLNFLKSNIARSNNNAGKAFHNIFMDLDIELEFTDNQMMAGLKHIALNTKDENERIFAELIIKEGGKNPDRIDLKHFTNL